VKSARKEVVSTKTPRSRISKRRLEELIEAATVERVNLTDDEQLVAVCTRGRHRQALPILDLPLPTPPPDGAEWIEGYRRWRGAG
jgi:hypothetical protein